MNAIAFTIGRVKPGKLTFIIPQYDFEVPQYDFEVPQYDFEVPQNNTKLTLWNVSKSQSGLSPDIASIVLRMVRNVIALIVLRLTLNSLGGLIK
ncbi:hypothetical protein NIES22_00360 [Calothrix brevissima NIES-22]|nr:hypothetical protein NIES22_00360 [Calothrix brevissima NIES-22]